MLGRPKVYFAHPVNVYDTELERGLLQEIAAAFPQYEILNPNAPEHRDGYQTYKEATGRGMDYFFQNVLPRAQACVVLAFRDCMFGTGTAAEALWFLRQGFPVWEIGPMGSIVERENIPDDQILSVEETRARIRDADGNTIPY